MIVLFNPRSSVSGKPILPMSILAMAAVIDGRYEYEIVDGNLLTDPLELLRRRISTGDVSVLAVTVMPKVWLVAAA